MAQKIILSSDEPIVCPQCQNRFEIGQGITRQTIERYEQDFTSALEERSVELRKDIEKETERKLERAHKANVDRLTEELTDKQKALDEAKANSEKIRQETKTKVLAEVESEKKLLEQELLEKEDKIKNFQEQEMALRQEKKKLEESRRELELDLQRKLDEATKNIEEQVRNTETERFLL